MSGEPHPGLEIVIETPAGSKNKYEVDPDTNAVSLSRRVRVAARFPVDYGYVPGRSATTAIHSRQSCGPTAQARARARSGAA